MRVVVTGGAGFIGSYVVAELESRGATPHVVDPRVGSSILETAFLEACDGADAVIHLAGVLGTSELFSSPEQAVEVNVRGAVRVLEACRMFGLGLTSITMPQVWTNVYSVTNDCARRLASAWHETYGIAVSTVVAYNAFGEGQKVHGPQKIIPTFAHRAWRDQPLPIWGSGQQTVDLIHASEVAKVLVDALDFGGDQILEAGSGVEWSVNDVAEIVLDVAGSDAGVEHLPMREGEAVDTRLAASGVGWDLLGYKPEFSVEQLAETIRWYRSDRD